jgi:hypothetical protein
MPYMFEKQREKIYLWNIYDIYLKTTYKKDLSDAKSSNEKSKNMSLVKVF